MIPLAGARHALISIAAMWVVTSCASAAPPGPSGQAGAPQSPAASRRIVATALGEPATLNAKVNAVQIPAPGADVLEELVTAGLAHGNGQAG